MIATACALISIIAPVGKTIRATDPRILKIGRFDHPAWGTERASWSASEIALKVRGTFLVVAIEDSGDNFIQVMINGTPTEVIQLGRGKRSYEIDLPTGDSEVRLIKRTEAFLGPISFSVFRTDGAFGRLKPRKHRIEFIGDSITCGYGNEGKSENEHFKPSTENAAMTYASIAARQLDADATLIAWSGRKMWPDFTIPAIYDFINPSKPSSKVNFARQHKPDVVVIHLATNDFGGANPDQVSWCAAYETFIHKLRRLYPRAQIYCAMGGMMSDEFPPDQDALSTLRGYIQTIVSDLSRAGDSRVSWIEFDLQRAEDGEGADWHPNIKTHRVMAEKLSQTIRHDLGW